MTKQTGMETKTERFRSLSHDLQGCLHTISIGLEVLKEARENEREFAEACELIDKNRKMAASLVGEFRNAACQAEE